MSQTSINTSPSDAHDHYGLESRTLEPINYEAYKRSIIPVLENMQHLHRTGTAEAQEKFAIERHILSLAFREPSLFPAQYVGKAHRNLAINSVINGDISEALEISVDLRKFSQSEHVYKEYNQAEQNLLEIQSIGLLNEITNVLGLNINVSSYPNPVDDFPDDGINIAPSISNLGRYFKSISEYVKRDITEHSLDGSNKPYKLMEELGHHATYWDWPIETGETIIESASAEGISERFTTFIETMNLASKELIEHGTKLESLLSSENAYEDITLFYVSKNGYDINWPELGTTLRNLSIILERDPTTGYIRNIPERANFKNLFKLANIIETAKASETHRLLPQSTVKAAMNS